MCHWYPHVVSKHLLYCPRTITWRHLVPLSVDPDAIWASMKSATFYQLSAINILFWKIDAGCSQLRRSSQTTIDSYAATFAIFTLYLWYGNKGKIDKTKNNKHWCYWRMIHITVGCGSYTTISEMTPVQQRRWWSVHDKGRCVSYASISEVAPTLQQCWRWLIHNNNIGDSSHTTIL